MAVARPSLDDLDAGIRAGDRAMLARAITLVESTKPAHFEQAQALLERLLPDTGGAQRLGISGVPGVGKSTFIESLGGHLTGRGHKVAVLAVDPSSGRSGGAILGDKTRMATLATDPNAFIRPSPAAGVLGGVARASRETLLLCEAAGYDVVIVETVGTGQSETEVADMVDFFLVLMLPGAGDELQGIKKGILELADMIAVNKADMDARAAERAARDYRSALHILTPESANWSPPVVTCAGLSGDGLAALWDEVERHRQVMTASGERDRRRREQRRIWLWRMVEGRLLAALKRHGGVRETVTAVEARVAEGRLPAAKACEEILAAFLGQAAVDA
ncbi:methylmalonyl-CoA mutase metallochaperone MeaB [Rhodothalassium salexigens DSM 2132]|uniref:Methylmalonyl-CoA mutase metallochaperone MeaB n=1 Tax=Rhodothalassium salexigens DSM 2132 TaxID=1188247 RepID=A0A4R2PQR3_RHOSA|nr:methylmalonyl Co-A mutase-associated GTPase MeaB [Rhodothalassium salexigens]MBB4209998.1 LAO/AO transport system kinase [Rhodothalassium salexigens DSM 2132]MBK1637630.1 methylmalonyl Co-A mutase-associated GTPase MeaB [Rhodothalassium salexigens DSM 2132]TCP38163.1 methylmalonyl-CoA mutase metallochaperone MeaB [Rhodothalassium salexigens DSM 2132]